MAMNAEPKSKFTALHRQSWRLHMSEKFASGTKTPKQTNKQTNSNYVSTSIATITRDYRAKSTRLATDGGLAVSVIWPLGA